MPGAFDDLMPAAPAASAAPNSGGAFDDLMPPAPTPAKPDLIPAGGGQPGLSSDPFAGLPTSVTQFLGGKDAATPIHKPWSGDILPVSGDGSGNWQWDSNAGLLGTVKRAVTLPGDVATGAVSPTGPEAIARSADLAGLATPLNPGVRAGEMAIPGVATAAQPAVVAPTTEALKTAAKAAYDDTAAAGVHYSSPAIAAVANGVQSDLEDKGILSVLAPKTHTILNAMQNIPDGPSTVPFGSLDAARKAFGFAANDFTNPTEQKAAKTAQSAIDNFVYNPPDDAVVAGDASAAADAIKDARANYAAAMRSDTLIGTPEEGARKYGVEGAADLSAAAANSGANTGNALRQRVKSLLLNPKASAGFSDDELAALKQVVTGSPTNNVARVVGNLLGGGGGHGAASLGLGLGAMGEYFGGPIGMAAGMASPILGAAAKHVDNAATRASLAKADELTRARSPLGAQMSAEAPPVFADPERQAALARALGLSDLSQQQPAYAAGGRVMDAAVPEVPATLAAQRQELIDGKRAVLLFKGGKRRIAPPKGCREFRLGEDVVQFDPEKTSEKAIRKAARDDTLGQLLKLGPVSKNEAVARIGRGETPVAVVERDPRGTELRAAAGTHVTAPSQIRHFQKTKSNSVNRLSIETPAHVLLHRLRHGVLQ